MAQTEISPAPAARAELPGRGRTTLDIVMLTGLTIAVVSNVLAMMIERAVIPPVLITTIVYAVCAVIVTTRWRWAMVFPLVLCTLGIIGDFSSGFPEYTLTHPSSNYVAFTLFVVSYPLLIIVIVSAALKLAQTLRHEQPYAPDWMKPTLGAVTGLILGAFLIGVAAQPAAAGSVATTGKGTQTIHLTSSTFAPDIIALHTGDTLTMIGDAPVPHTITNGTWSASNQPQPGIEPGAPVIKNVQLDGSTMIVGPFTSPGTYHLYCTVHPGMVLTVIVQ
jgi:plastocyanin